MSTTETGSTLSRHFRLEVRNGRAGWRCHARGPQGIEWTSPYPHATRDLALEEGRETLRQAGLDSWDEWMDGITDNFFDPRAQRQLSIDAVAEAKAAGLEPPDPKAQEEAVKKLRELEQRRADATAAAQEKKLQSPDVGMGVNEEQLGKETPPPPKAESPLKQQRRKSSAAKEE